MLTAEPNKIQLPGIIQVLLPGYTFEETERCRQIIHTLFEGDFFSIRNGRAIVDFTPEGLVRKIVGEKVQWIRDREALTKISQRPTIKVEQLNTQPQPMSGAPK